MTIDPLVEEIVTLSAAASLYPSNARGKKPHVSAIYRHTTHGLRGIQLECIQCGSKRCTSRQAIARFFARLTALAEDAPSSVARDTTNPLKCVRAAGNDRAAEDKLDRLFGPSI